MRLSTMEWPLPSGRLAVADVGSLSKKDLHGPKKINAYIGYVFIEITIVSIVHSC